MKLYEVASALFVLAVSACAPISELNDAASLEKAIPATASLANSLENYQTYIEPNEYSIEYPTSWKLEKKDRIIGNEILQICSYRKELKKSEIPPNVVKISISIDRNYSQPLDDLVTSSFSNDKTDSVQVKRQEKFWLNGQEVIRVYWESPLKKDAPGISLFMNYKDGKYVKITSWYGKDSSEITINKIKRIQESFVIL